MRRTVKIIVILVLVYLLAGFFIPPLLNESAAQCIPQTGSISEGDRIRCIDDNMDALLWRLRLIASAEDSIELSTNDFVDDESGKDIMSALLDAADRGVRVRILMDGFNGVSSILTTPAQRGL